MMFLNSCQSKKKEPEYKSVPFEKMSSSSVLQNVDPEDLESMNDTICGMSLKDGVADTLHVGSKIYGFCNSGCKRKFSSIINTPL